MATNYHVEEFAVSADRLWSLLTKWDGLRDWWLPREFIADVELVGEGDGAVRIITHSVGSKVGERLDGADHERKIITLSIVDPVPPGVIYYRATGRVHPIDARHCRLEWMSAYKTDDSAGGKQFAAWLPAVVADMFKGLQGAVSA